MKMMKFLIMYFIGFASWIVIVDYVVRCLNEKDHERIEEG